MGMNEQPELCGSCGAYWKCDCIGRSAWVVTLDRGSADETPFLRGLRETMNANGYKVYNVSPLPTP